MPRKRCPNGTRKNPKTGECIPKTQKLKSGKKKSNKIRNTQSILAKKMREELLNKGKLYHNFKKEQIDKKKLGRKIKANNLIKTKRLLKKLKDSSFKSNKKVKKKKLLISSSKMTQIDNTKIKIPDSILKTTILKHGNGSKTINGHSLKLLKSAMQKYIRRANDKALTVFGELNIFSSLCHPDNINFKKYLELHSDLKESTIKKNGKGTITNTINRLRAIVSEDISVAGPGIPAIADELIEKYYLDISNPYPILKLIKILIESKKIRILSDLKTVYNLPPYYGKNENDNKLIEKYTLWLNNIYDNKVENNAPKDSTDIISDNILYYFKEKDLNIFYWISKLIYKDGINSLYKLIDELNKETRNIDVVVLMKWFKLMKHKERSLYLYHSLIILMNDIKSVKIEIDDTIMFPKLKKHYLNSLKKYTIDSWCMDIHTGEKGATVIEFGEVGADVTNQSKKWFNQTYRDMYIHLKYVLVHRPETQEDMALLYKPQKTNEYKEEVKTKKKKIIKKKTSSNTSLNTSLNTNSDVDESKLKKNNQSKNSIDLSHLNETDLFSIIARAQIPTSFGKTDVYFGKSLNSITGYPNGTRVVIKGPYIKGDKGYEFALDINNIKKVLSLPRNDKIMLIKMKPNRWGSKDFKDGRTGVRYNKDFDNTTPYWFMISIDYLKNIELPIKIYRTKTWTETQIIDFEKLVSLKDNTFNKWDAHTWEKSSDKNKMEFVSYILFRYMMGIGDFAARNFVFIDDTIYGIDEDAPKKGKLNTFRSLLNKTRSTQVSTWIENNWDNVSKFIDKLIKIKDNKIVTDIIILFKGYEVKDPLKIYGDENRPNKLKVLKMFD